MKRLIFLLSLCCIGFSSSLVVAQETEEYSEFARKGFYAAVGGIYAFENFNRTNGILFDDAPGFNLRLGYRLHPYIAVEAEGERTMGFDVKQFNGDINTWVATINGKVFALTGQFQPYGLLGVGAMNATTNGSLVFVGSNGRPSTNETDVVFRYGAGVDAYVTKNWVVNLEGSYINPRGDVGALEYFTIGGGLQYRF